MSKFIDGLVIILLLMIFRNYPFHHQYKFKPLNDLANTIFKNKTQDESWVFHLSYQ